MFRSDLTERVILIAEIQYLEEQCVELRGSNITFVSTFAFLDAFSTPRLLALMVRMRNLVRKLEK